MDLVSNVCANGVITCKMIRFELFARIRVAGACKHDETFPFWNGSASVWRGFDAC